MNRIYQGRVSKVEVFGGKDAEGKEQWNLLGFSRDKIEQLEKERVCLRRLAKTETPEGINARQKLAELNRQLREPWQTALWEHHQLFQDDVNFYLATFAAMVPLDCKDELWCDYRDTIERSWEIYTGRQGAWKWPLARVCKAIGCSETASFQDFRKKLFSLSGSTATEGQRYAALREIFESAVETARKMESPDESLEESLKGKGKNLFNKLVVLCARRTGETSGETKGAQRIGAREATLKVKEGARLTWDDVFLFKTSLGGEAWPRKEAATELLQFLDDVADCIAGKAESIEDKLKTLTKLEQITKLEQRRLELSRLAESIKKRRPEFETWINKPETELPDQKPSRKGSGGYDLKSAVLFALRPEWNELRETFLLLNGGRLNEEASAPREDACYAARFAGSAECRVVPFFLDLWTQRLNDDLVRQGVWPDFEKQAFMEVFNKIGQFIIRERKFELRWNEAYAKIEKIENQLKKDPRLQSVKEIADNLAATSGAVNDSGTPRLYSIRERTLKAWPKVRRTWRTLLASDPKATAEQLVQEKNRLQKKLREKFGSAPLFNMLAMHRDVWDHDEADQLPVWADYVEAKEEKEHLEIERLFAPAHPTLSPRYFRWAETNNKTHLPLSDDGALMVDVDALDFEKKQKSSVRLHFRAPRLLRDSLRRRGEKLDKEKPDQIWLPPALRPLVEKYKWQCDPQTFAGTAVRLAPTRPVDIQLVFEPELSVGQLSALWANQFPFTPDNRKLDGEWKTTGIRWPKNKDEKFPWYDALEVKCLGVDRGLVHGAAWQILCAVREPKVLNDKRLSHRLTPTSYPEQWRAYAIANGIVRVAGEDKWIWREIGADEKESLLNEAKKSVHERNGFARKFFAANKGLHLPDASFAFLPELSGSVGRNALPYEIDEAAAIFETLKTYGYDISKRSLEWKKLRSFPEQNDDLIWGLKRVRSQLFRLHRWGVQLHPKSKDKSRDSALSIVSNLKSDDPLIELRDLNGNTEALQKRIASLWQNYRDCLIKLLPVIANRVLPVRKGTWTWETCKETGWSKMHLDIGKPRPDAWLAGQRGVSLARLNQLRDLRQLAQSLNHLCRHKADEHYQTRRGEAVPEPFRDCLDAMEDAREDRAKQIAHDLFAAALGVELAPPPAGKAERKRTESLHGIYRSLNRGPVNFIALEDLGGYRTSFKQGRRENRQLSSWSHNRVHKILTELCEMVGLPIVVVPAGFTSHLSAKDNSVGFRAEEVRKDDPRRENWQRIATEQNDQEWAEFVRWLDIMPEGKTLLIPKRGGGVFVSLQGEVEHSPDGVLYHADLNAAYRIALKGLAQPNCVEAIGTAWIAVTTKSKSGKTTKDLPHVVDVAKKLPGSQPLSPDFNFLPAWKAEDAWEQIYGDIGWKRCHEINAARLKNWGIKVPTLQSSNDDDDLNF